MTYRKALSLHTRLSSNSKKKLQAKCTHHDGNYIEVEGRSEGGQKFYPAIKEEVGGGS